MPTSILAFNRWDCSGIKVQDLGLEPYLCTKPTLVPKTGARYAGARFHKSRVFLVERLINRVMVPGHQSKKHKRTSYHATGKSQTAYRLVEDALTLLEKRFKKNPVEILVKAVENAAPREEIITIEYGGARYPKAVEVAPQRRVDLVLKIMTQGAYGKSFNSKKAYVDCLSDEIGAAYQSSANSAAIAKKLELERQADSSR